MTEQEALKFYNKHKQRLFNTSMRILNNAMDAEEVVQDTVLKYLTNSRIQEYGFSEGQIGAWLHKTCVRASVDILRKRNAYNEMKEQCQEADPDMGSEESSWKTGVRNELLERIQKNLMTLSDGYRTVFSLVLFEGYDYSEVAMIMNVSESTVRSQFLRAKKKLIENMNLMQQS